MFKIKKHRRARDRWKVQARATDAANRLNETDIHLEGRSDMGEHIVSLDEMDTKVYQHAAKIPKDAEPIGCVMIVLCKDPVSGRTGALLSGHPSMDYFVMQDILDAGDKMLKNLIRYTNPPKQDLSHIILPGDASLSNLLGR